MSDGSPVPEARVTHPNGGVFRYMLVEAVDRFGHHVRYEYALRGDDERPVHPLLLSRDGLDNPTMRPAKGARWRFFYNFQPRLGQESHVFVVVVP